MPPTSPIPVAGIGASAGGLAVTSELLRNLGPRPGIALVIVHRGRVERRVIVNDLSSLRAYADLVERNPVLVRHVVVF